MIEAWSSVLKTICVTAWLLCTLMCFTYDDSLAAKFSTIELIYCITCFCFILHFDKTKTSAGLCFTVSNYNSILDLSYLPKEICKILARRLIRKLADVESHTYLLLILLLL